MAEPVYPADSEKAAQAHTAQPQGFSSPATSQPMTVFTGAGPANVPGSWMTRPENVPLGVPPGLEYLTLIDQIICNQTVELLEAIAGIECKNRFIIRNSTGQQIYFAAEESGFCMRQCCGPERGFVMHVYDHMGQEVIRGTKQFRCCSGCCWCTCINHCAFEIVVEAPLGTVCGYVRQSCSVIKPVFEVLDENHDPVLYLEGPICICECPCFDVNFNLTTYSGNKVGKVSKQWSGFVKELFTEADNFGINFPMDLDVKVKATLIGAVFLINMMFFERNSG